LIKARAIWESHDRQWSWLAKHLHPAEALTGTDLE